MSRGKFDSNPEIAALCCLGVAICEKIIHPHAPIVLQQSVSLLANVSITNTKQPQQTQKRKVKVSTIPLISQTPIESIQSQPEEIHVNDIVLPTEEPPAKKSKTAMASLLPQSNDFPQIIDEGPDSDEFSE